MRTKQELLDRLRTYKGAEYIYTDNGYIAWQYSTGENIEIIFIESKEKGLGYGRELVREMCKIINPYYSVFVMRLASNEDAGKFYRALGFREYIIRELYKGDDAIIGVIPFAKLCQNLLIK